MPCARGRACHGAAQQPARLLQARRHPAVPRARLPASSPASDPSLLPASSQASDPSLLTPQPSLMKQTGGGSTAWRGSSASARELARRPGALWAALPLQRRAPPMIQVYSAQRVVASAARCHRARLTALSRTTTRGTRGGRVAAAAPPRRPGKALRSFRRTFKPVTRGRRRLGGQGAASTSLKGAGLRCCGTAAMMMMVMMMMRAAARAWGGPGGARRAGGWSGRGARTAERRWDEAGRGPR